MAILENFEIACLLAGFPKVKSASQRCPIEEVYKALSD
jgi:hypothetical protein